MTEGTHHAISRYKDLGELQYLLLTACPPDKRGKASVPVLAQHLGVSHQYVYRWIEEDRVPADFVRPLVEMSNGRVTYEQFHAYAFR